LPRLKEQLGTNLELAAPDDFIPALPGWGDRSRYIGREGVVDFFHYDPYGQALAKIERGHAQDLADVREMFRARARRAGASRPVLRRDRARPRSLSGDRSGLFPDEGRGSPGRAAPEAAAREATIEAIGMKIPRELPGAAIVVRGIQDLTAGRKTIPTLLAAIGARRLRRLGLPLPAADRLPARPEKAPYRRLVAESGAGAHSEFNALVRRLVSFERATRRRARFSRTCSGACSKIARAGNA
jgi:hypothetical protein